MPHKGPYRPLCRPPRVARAPPRPAVRGCRSLSGAAVGGRRGRRRVMHMHGSYNGIKLRMGPLCRFFSPLPSLPPPPPQWFDTVITVHLEGGKKRETPAAHPLISIHLWRSQCSASYFVIMCCHLCLRSAHLSPLPPFSSVISCWFSQAGTGGGREGWRAELPTFIPRPLHSQDVGARRSRAAERWRGG